MNVNVKRLLSILSISLVLFTYINIQDSYASEWPAGPTMTSGSAILMDAETGTILYAYNEDAKNYPASITKVLTTLVALENSSPTDIITFSHDAIFNIDTGSTHIGMKEGEQITMGDALYAVMLASANEVSNGVAETVAGSNEAFAELMNKKAQSLGCTNSNFVNPHGLHNDNHYTSCHDMALICREALKNETFRQITSTITYSIGPTNLESESRGFTNHQQMLSGIKYPQYKYEGCIGGKTGYTDSASNTLVSFAERNGMTLITVVMASDFNAQYTDSIALMDYGFNNFKLMSINENEGTEIKGELSLFQRYYELGKDNSACIYVENGSNIILPASAEYSEASKTIAFSDNIDAQTGKNVVGNISYTYNDHIVGNYNIIMNMYPSSSLPTISLPDEIENYSVTLNGEDGTTAAAVKLKPALFDTILAVLCLLIILTVFTFVKTMLKRRKRKRAYHSRRRHSKKYWDDLDI